MVKISAPFPAGSPLESMRAELEAYRAVAPELMSMGHYIGCNRGYLDYPTGPECSWVCLRLQEAVKARTDGN